MRPFGKVLITAASALVIAAVGILPSQGAPPVQSRHLPAGWRYVWRATTKASNVLSSVAVLGRNNAWAVGGTAAGSYVVRWNGRRWRSRSLPFPGYQALTIRATGSDDVWIFGATNQPLAPEALRWDGAKWHTVAMPGWMVFAQAVVLGPDDVWYEGVSNDAAWLFHWNGLVWSTVATPNGVAVTDISATSQGNFWIAGTRLGARPELAAFRRVGTSWSSEALPQHGMPTNFTQVDALSLNDVWLVANAHGSRQAWILHWNGRKWHLLSGAPEHQGPANPIAPFGTSGIWAGSCLAWTGRTWLTPCTAATIPGMDMATVPGSRSTWLVGYYNTSRTHTVGEIALYGPVP